MLPPPVAALAAEEGVRISEHTPFFPPDSPTLYAPTAAVVAWLADTLRPPDEGSGERGCCATGGGAVARKAGERLPRRAKGRRLVGMLSRGALLPPLLPQQSPAVPYPPPNPVPPPHPPTPQTLW